MPGMADLSTLHPVVAVAARAAFAAAALIRAAAADPGALQVREKQRNDFVTQVDEAAEQAIVIEIWDEREQPSTCDLVWRVAPQRACPIAIQRA